MWNRSQWIFLTAKQFRKYQAIRVTMMKKEYREKAQSSHDLNHLPY
jgi:hypothetical protein